MGKEQWAETTLETIAKWQSGGTPTSTNSEYYGDAIPWLIIGDLNDGLIFSSAKSITQKGLDNSSAKLVPIDSVLIAMYGSIGKLGIAKIPCATNQAIAFTEHIYGGIPNRFLYYYLFSIKNYLLDIGKGGAQQNISQTVLKAVSFPLPPLAEQHRIVARLDAIMERMERNKKRLDKIPALLKRFRQSVLASAMGGVLFETKTAWIDVELNSLIDKGGIFDGPFGSNLKTDDYVGKGVRVIRLENIEHLSFIQEKEKFITEEKYSTLTRHTVGDGDIIFSSFISEEIRACILPNLSTKAVAKADCFCIRPNINKVDKKFLLLSLVSRNSYDQLVQNIHGATRPRINTTQLKKLILSIPQLEEQKEIVRRVEQLFAFADKVEARYAKSKVLLDKLPQSILAKAFRGELVAQDENDEPASILLKRISASKLSASKAKSSRLKNKGKSKSHSDVFLK